METANLWVSQKRTSAAEAVKHRRFTARLKPCPSYRDASSFSFLAVAPRQQFVQNVPSQLKAVKHVCRVPGSTVFRSLLWPVNASRAVHNGQLKNLVWTKPDIGFPARELMRISVARARNQGKGLSLSLPETRLNCACGGLVNGTQIRQHS
jgi:hypothetical protein